MGAMQEAAARHVGRDGVGGGDGQRRSELDAAHPWNLEVLSRQLGSNNIEELAQRVNEPNEKIRLMAMVRAGGNVDEAAALLESEGEARAQQIGAEREVRSTQHSSSGNSNGFEKEMSMRPAGTLMYDVHVLSASATEVSAFR